MLERKDLRIKLDPEIHGALTVFADVERKELAELAEAVIAAEVRRRVHETTVAAAKLARLGIIGSGKE